MNSLLSNSTLSTKFHATNRLQRSKRTISEILQHKSIIHFITPYNKIRGNCLYNIIFKTILNYVQQTHPNHSIFHKFQELQARGAIIRSRSKPTVAESTSTIPSIIHQPSPNTITFTKPSNSTPSTQQQIKSTTTTTSTSTQISKRKNNNNKKKNISQPQIVIPKQIFHLNIPLPQAIPQQLLNMLYGYSFQLPPLAYQLCTDPIILTRFKQDKCKNDPTYPLLQHNFLAPFTQPTHKILSQLPEQPIVSIPHQIYLESLVLTMTHFNQRSNQHDQKLNQVKSKKIIQDGTKTTPAIQSLLTTMSMDNINIDENNIITTKPQLTLRQQLELKLDHEHVNIILLKPLNPDLLISSIDFCNLWLLYAPHLYHDMIRYQYLWYLQHEEYCQAWLECQEKCLIYEYVQFCTQNQIDIDKTILSPSGLLLLDDITAKITTTAITTSEETSSSEETITTQSIPNRNRHQSSNRNASPKKSNTNNLQIGSTFNYFAPRKYYNCLSLLQPKSWQYSNVPYPSNIMYEKRPNGSIIASAVQAHLQKCHVKIHHQINTTIDQSDTDLTLNDIENSTSSIPTQQQHQQQSHSKQALKSLKDATKLASKLVKQQSNMSNSTNNNNDISSTTHNQQQLSKPIKSKRINNPFPNYFQQLEILRSNLFHQQPTHWDPNFNIIHDSFIYAFALHRYRGTLISIFQSLITIEKSSSTTSNINDNTCTTTNNMRLQQKKDILSRKTINRLFNHNLDNDQIKQPQRLTKHQLKKKHDEEEKLQQEQANSKIPPRSYQYPNDCDNDYYQTYIVDDIVDIATINLEQFATIYYQKLSLASQINYDFDLPTNFNFIPKLFSFGEIFTLYEYLPRIHSRSMKRVTTRNNTNTVKIDDTTRFYYGATMYQSISSMKRRVQKQKSTPSHSKLPPTITSNRNNKNKHNKDNTSTSNQNNNQFLKPHKPSELNEILKQLPQHSMSWIEYFSTQFGSKCQNIDDLIILLNGYSITVDIDHQSNKDSDIGSYTMTDDNDPNQDDDINNDEKNNINVIKSDNHQIIQPIVQQHQIQLIDPSTRWLFDDVQVIPPFTQIYNYHTTKQNNSKLQSNNDDSILSLPTSSEASSSTQHPALSQQQPQLPTIELHHRLLQCYSSISNSNGKIHQQQHSIKIEYSYTTRQIETFILAILHQASSSTLMCLLNTLKSTPAMLPIMLHKHEEHHNNNTNDDQDGKLSQIQHNHNNSVQSQSTTTTSTNHPAASENTVQLDETMNQIDILKHLKHTVTLEFGNQLFISDLTIVDFFKIAATEVYAKDVVDNVISLVHDNSSN